MAVSQVSLRNMLRLSQAGAILCTPTPGFDLHPKSVDDIVDFVVGKLLDLLDVKHDLDTRWQGASPARSDD